MKLSKQQLTAVKSIATFMFTMIIVFPILHLIKGNFNWSDTLQYGCLAFVVGAVLMLIYILGMKVHHSQNH